MRAKHEPATHTAVDVLPRIGGGVWEGDDTLLIGLAALFLSEGLDGFLVVGQASAGTYGKDGTAGTEFGVGIALGQKPGAALIVQISV